MRCWRTLVFLEWLLCGENVFPQRLTVFSLSTRLGLPFFTIFPPLLTYLGEPLRW